MYEWTLGGGRSILLSYRNIFDFSCIFKAFRPSRIRSLARKSSKTSNENRLIRGGCFITPITPSLELSLIFVPQSVRIERSSCFSGSSESFVKNVLRRRLFYPLNYGDLHKVDASLHLNAAAEPASDLRLSDQIPLIDQDIKLHIIAAKGNVPHHLTGQTVYLCITA